MRTAGRRSLVLAAVLALAPFTVAQASPTPPGDDPELAALLLTTADLPPGWNAFSVGAPPTADAGTNLDDPCVALLHRFDTAYGSSPRSTSPTSPAARTWSEPTVA